MPVEGVEDLFGPMSVGQLPLKQEPLVREDGKPTHSCGGGCHSLFKSTEYYAIHIEQI